MRRTLLLLLGLALICGVLLVGRHYLDAHPALLGAIAIILAFVGYGLW